MKVTKLLKLIESKENVIVNLELFPDYSGSIVNVKGVELLSFGNKKDMIAKFTDMYNKLKKNTNINWEL